MFWFAFQRFVGHVNFLFGEVLCCYSSITNLTVARPSAVTGNTEMYQRWRKFSGNVPHKPRGSYVSALWMLRRAIKTKLWLLAPFKESCWWQLPYWALRWGHMACLRPARAEWHEPGLSETCIKLFRNKFKRKCEQIQKMEGENHNQKQTKQWPKPT